MLMNKTKKRSPVILPLFLILGVTTFMTVLYLGGNKDYTKNTSNVTAMSKKFMHHSNAATGVGTNDVDKVSDREVSIASSIKRSLGIIVEESGCHFCDDRETEPMKAKYELCADFVHNVHSSLLENKCNKDYNWIEHKFCRRSCSKAGFPYAGDKCCHSSGPTPTNKPTNKPTKYYRVEHTTTTKRPTQKPTNKPTKKPTKKPTHKPIHTHTKRPTPPTYY